MATGGNGAIFGKSTNSVVCTGSAQSALYQQGAYYANGEFIQVHPTCIPGEDKLRLMSESARGEGGRVWVPKTAGRQARSQEHSRERALVLPRGVVSEVRQPGAARRRDARHSKVVYEHNLGIDGQPMVYLDLTHIDRKILDRKLEGILEIYEKFVGDDPRDVPMKIFPGMHYTMGGLWVDFDQKTNIEGLYACGECDYSIHGANRLGANSLMSCIYGGFVAGPNAVKYARNVDQERHARRRSRVRVREASGRKKSTQRLINNEGTENPFLLWRELGDTDDQERAPSSATTRTLQETDAKLVELLERYRHVNLSDQVDVGEHVVRLRAPALQHAATGARDRAGRGMRDESRGAHYKPDFPERDDANWLKTTKAYFAADADEPRFEFEPVDTSLIKPRPRRYDAAT